MRKFIAVLLAVLLCLGCACADETQKAPDFVMEGFDGDSANHDWDTNLFFQRRQEATGISFEFRQYTDFDKWTVRKQDIMNGADLPDVMFKASLTTMETEKLYADGTIIDLKPYLEQYAPDLWALLQSHPEWEKAITLADGSIPALPNFNELQNINAVWINRTWLNNLKIEMPENAEELTETLRMFRDNDPNKNGKADEIPLTFIGMWDLRFLGHAFGIIDNDYYVTVKDGVVKSSLKTGENREFLTWLNQLWRENLLDHNGFTTVDTTRQITDSKASIPYGAMLSVSPMTVVPTEALGQYEVMPPLTYNGQRIYRDLLGEVIRGTFAITKACASPEKLIEWVNFLYTEEGGRLAISGLEGTEYRWNEDGTWEWLEDTTTVANDVLPSATISEGGTIPGLTTADFQLKYADTDTHNAVSQLYTLRKYALMPYPYVSLNEEDTARVAELQQAVSPYAEQTMACFVTGDLEMNDENWNAFCEELDRRGLDEMLGIWQKYTY